MGSKPTSPNNGGNSNVAAGGESMRQKKRMVGKKSKGAKVRREVANSKERLNDPKQIEEVK